MFEAWITREGATFEGVVYQILLVGSTLCAVYRFSWEKEWNITNIKNVEPKREDLK